MAALKDLKDAIAAERVEVQAKLSDLAVQLKALQDQIAAGAPITPADLDALVVSVGQISEPLPPAA